jgi:hypothetical protein
LSSQVLLIQLLTHEINGVAILQRGEPGFFGIQRVAIPAEQRALFDASPIHSADQVRRSANALEGVKEDLAALKTRIKRLVKLWETAGLQERSEPGGGALLYTYDPKLHRKQREQQAKSRAAKRPLEADPGNEISEHSACPVSGPQRPIPIRPCKAFRVAH